MRKDEVEKQFQIRLADGRERGFNTAFELFQWAVGNSRFIRNDCLNYDQAVNKPLENWFEERIEGNKHPFKVKTKT